MNITEQMINHHYPPMSEKRHELRQKWNKEIDMQDGIPIDWNEYLKKHTMNAIIGKQLEYLNNAAQSIPIQGIEVMQKQQTDKRKTNPVYVLTINGTSCISPTLDYDKMNHYILGMTRACKLFNNQ